MQEEKACKDTEKAVERKIRLRQNSDLFIQKDVELVKYKDIKLRQFSAKQNLIEKTKIQNDYHNTMTKIISINQESLQDDYVYKKQMANKQFEISKIYQQYFDNRNTYSNTLKSKLVNLMFNTSIVY